MIRGCVSGPLKPWDDFTTDTKWISIIPGNFSLALVLPGVSELLAPKQMGREGNHLAPCKGPMAELGEIR